MNIHMYVYSLLAIPYWLLDETHDLVGGTTVYIYIYVYDIDATRSKGVNSSIISNTVARSCR